MSSKNDFFSNYVSLKQLNDCENDKILVKVHEKTKLKQKRISNEVRKADRKSRMSNKPTNDLLSRFKVLIKPS